MPKKQASKELETFPNPHPDRDYDIHMECPEFTCLCPMTGQLYIANEPLPEIKVFGVKSINA